MTDELALGAQGPPDFPVGLDRRRHRDEPWSPWIRRVAVAAMFTLCLLALLNVFGQVATMTSVDSPQVSLSVNSPERLRGGLLYTSDYTISTHQPVQDLRMVLAPGWFSGVTFNGSAPQAQQETSDGSGTTFDYGQTPAGQSMTIYISWQMNPTTVGSRNQDVWLYDGQKLLLTMHRTAVVFP
jgi:hypothetical protein